MSRVEMKVRTCIAFLLMNKVSFGCIRMCVTQQTCKSLRLGFALERYWHHTATGLADLYLLTELINDCDKEKTD